MGDIQEACETLPCLESIPEKVYCAEPHVTWLFAIGYFARIVRRGLQISSPSPSRGGIQLRDSGRYFPGHVGYFLEDLLP